MVLLLVFASLRTPALSHQVLELIPPTKLWSRRKFIEWRGLYPSARILSLNEIVRNDVVQSNPSPYIPGLISVHSNGILTTYLLILHENSRSPIPRPLFQELQISYKQLKNPLRSNQGTRMISFNSSIELFLPCDSIKKDSNYKFLSIKWYPTCWMSKNR